MNTISTDLEHCAALIGSDLPTLDMSHNVENLFESPIQQLPLEVLSDIFILCLPPRTQDQDFLTSAEAPLLLCHICSAWRKVAMGLPPLWNNLSLMFHDRISDLDCEEIVELVDFWFGNAGNTPISFSFFHDPHVSGSILRDILRSHSNRFSKLIVQTTSSQHFAALLRGRVERLEYLALNFSAHPRRNDNQPIASFQFAPRLRKVSFGAYFNKTWLDFAAPRVLLPWGQLTHLHIDEILPTMSWHAILSQCPHLEYCDCSIDIYDPPADMDVHRNRPLVSMPNLIDLTLRTAVDLVFSSYSLCWLALPALQKLEIRDSVIDSPWVQAFRDILQTRTLRHLTLYCNFGSVDGHIELLRAVSCVTEFYLWPETLLEEDHGVLWEALTIGHASTVVLPMLEDIRVLTDDFEHLFRANQFAQMIASRCRIADDVSQVQGAPSRLQSLSLHLGSAKEVAEMKRLLGHCSLQGLSLCIDTQHDWEYRCERWGGACWYT